MRLQSTTAWRFVVVATSVRSEFARHGDAKYPMNLPMSAPEASGVARRGSITVLLPLQYRQQISTVDSCFVSPRESQETEHKETNINRVLMACRRRKHAWQDRTLRKLEATPDLFACAHIRGNLWRGCCGSYPDDVVLKQALTNQYMLFFGTSCFGTSDLHNPLFIDNDVETIPVLR